MNKIIRIVTLASVIAPVFALAQIIPAPQNPGMTYTSISALFLQLLTPLSQAFGSIVFGLSIFIFIYAGFLYMTAGDDEGRIESAKNYIIYGVVGLIVVILAWSIPVIVNSLFRGGFQ